MRRSHEKPLKRKAVKRCKKSDAKNAVPTTTDLEPLGPSNGLPHRSRAVQAAATKAGLDGHFLGPWHIAEQAMMENDGMWRYSEVLGLWLITAPWRTDLCKPRLTEVTCSMRWLSNMAEALWNPVSYEQDL